MNTYELLAKEEKLLVNAERLLSLAWDEAHGTSDATSYATEALAIVALVAELRIRRVAS